MSLEKLMKGGGLPFAALADKSTGVNSSLACGVYSKGSLASYAMQAFSDHLSMMASNPFKLTYLYRTTHSGQMKIGTPFECVGVPLGGSGFFACVYCWCRFLLTKGEDITSR